MSLCVTFPTWGGDISISHCQALWALYFLCLSSHRVALSRGRGVASPILAIIYNLPNWIVYHFISPMHRIIVLQTLCLWTQNMPLVPEVAQRESWAEDEGSSSISGSAHLQPLSQRPRLLFLCKDSDWSSVWTWERGLAHPSEDQLAKKSSRTTSPCFSCCLSHMG